MFGVPSRGTSVLLPFVVGTGTFVAPGSVHALAGARRVCVATDSLFLVYWTCLTAELGFALPWLLPST